MKPFLVILLLASIFSCGGCQTITTSMKESLDSMSNDYQRITTGSKSTYIASQRRQP